MRHLHTGRKLGVAPHHRKALLRNLTLALIEREAIQTTPARAKEIRWFADRVVTLAKRGDVHGRRHIVKLLGSTETKVPGQNRIRTAVDRIYTLLVPRFKDRPGGYTQIFRLAPRRAGDNAEMCLMRYLPDENEKKGGAKDKGAKAKAKPEKKADKKIEAAAGKPGKVKEKAAPQDKVEDKKGAKPKKKEKEG